MCFTDIYTCVIYHLHVYMCACNIYIYICIYIFIYLCFNYYISFAYRHIYTCI